MMTINLAEQLLAHARRLLQHGQSRTALIVLRQLLRLRDLPVKILEEAHARLGVLHLKARRFSQARRHLLAALHCDRSQARYHYHMGLACHHDPEGDLDRAARFYRRSLRLEPGHVRCLGESGRLEIQLGNIDEGLGLLRQAVENAPEDVTVISRLVRALQQAGRAEEAVREVRVALFRLPRCPQLRSLWMQVQFDSLRRKQQRDEDRSSTGPVVLPFLRLADTPDNARNLRTDAPSALPGPHLVRLTPRPRRHSS